MRYLYFAIILLFFSGCEIDTCNENNTTISDSNSTDSNSTESDDNATLDDDKKDYDLDKNIDDVTEGEDINETDGNSTEESEWYKPTIDTTWQWQLSGDVNSSYDVDLYIINFDDKNDSLITLLLEDQRKVICHMSKWDANSVDNSSRDLLNEVVFAIDLADFNSCSGVIIDNNTTGISLSSSDYQYISNQAHEKGLSIGLKNSKAMVEELVSYFDFSLNEQCHENSECDSYSLFIDNAKAVFNAEYQPPYETNSTEKEDMCSDTDDLGFQTLILSSDLDGSYRDSCE
jgi:hypothetical protein